jgi:hypothetical protein
MNLYKTIFSEFQIHKLTTHPKRNYSLLFSQTQQNPILFSASSIPFDLGLIPFHLGSIRR